MQAIASRPPRSLKVQQTCRLQSQSYVRRLQMKKILMSHRRNLRTYSSTQPSRWLSRRLSQNATNQLGIQRMQRRTRRWNGARARHTLQPRGSSAS